MMAKPTAQSKRCSESTRAGRLDKARQFCDAADILDTLVSDGDPDVVDAYVTLCVHAGIAAADVICCARLGVHAQGQDHNEATLLLATADKAASRHLATLLALKTRSGYGALKSSRSDRTRAKRAAHALVDAAERIT
ncbi:MAG TPA: hypothetical protein VEP49_02365 [Acidimicrobiia bacterium]|nr:hypothetical protein [Acidimicrobiia bacterium]